MPLNHDPTLTSDERLALASCLRADFNLEQSLEIKWITEKQCE
jgi:hypothetical protein